MNIIIHSSRISEISEVPASHKNSPKSLIIAVAADVFANVIGHERKFIKCFSLLMS